MSLVLAGLAGAGFFLLTDPRWQVPPHAGSTAGTANVVDAVNQAAPGTVIGIAGGAVVAGIGVWLMTRRAA